MESAWLPSPPDTFDIGELMTSIFVVCFLFGLTLSVISFLSGFEHVNVFDHIFHGHGGPGHTHGHAHAHGGRTLGHAAKGKVSPFNLAGLTMFVTWFGGGGAVLERTVAWPRPLIVALAVAIGMAGAWIVNGFIGIFVRAESQAPRISMVGTIARVTLSIREGGGTGEIVYTVGGARQVAGARSEGGRPIDRGTEVVVTRHERGIAYVSTWDELTAGGLDAVRSEAADPPPP